MELLDAGCLDEDDCPWRDCSPPTTPPMIAAATTRARMRPESSQKCFCRRPHILFFPEGEDRIPSSISLGPVGDSGLSVPSGDVGIPMGAPKPACSCFSRGKNPWLLKGWSSKPGVFESSNWGS